MTTGLQKTLDGSSHAVFKRMCRQTMTNGDFSQIGYPFDQGWQVGDGQVMTRIDAHAQRLRSIGSGSQALDFRAQERSRTLPM